MAKYKVLVDKEKCIGCGACESVCGEVFYIKDGKAHVKAGAGNTDKECVKEAKESCPVDAISVS